MQVYFIDICSCCELTDGVGSCPLQFAGDTKLVSHSKENLCSLVAEFGKVGER